MRKQREGRRITAGLQQAGTSSPNTWRICKGLTAG